MSSRIPTGRPTRESGFTVVAILLLVSVMASLAATFSKHVIVDAESTIVSSTMQDSMELLDSQLDFVLQSQRVGQAVDVTSLETAVKDGVVGNGVQIKKAEKKMLVDDVQAQEVEEVAADVKRARFFTSVVTDTGIGATRLIEAGRVPTTLTSAPDKLPGLDPDVAWDILGGGTIERLDVTQSTLLEDADFEGVIVVHEPSMLTLRNTVVRGTILSASASLGSVPGSYSAFLAPKLVLQGSTRLVAGDALPGLAVLMPDGAVAAEDPLGRVQIVGDVVAHGVSLLSPGTFEGNIATVTPANLSGAIDRVGGARGRREWSSVLDHHGAWEPRFLAFVPRELGWDDVSAITSFELPVKSAHGASVQSVVPGGDT